MRRMQAGSGRPMEGLVRERPEGEWGGEGAELMVTGVGGSGECSRLFRSVSMST